MKKLSLLWRLFIISALFLVILSIVVASRPLEDSAYDDVLVCIPFFSIYYIIFSIHILGIYEEKVRLLGRRN